MSQSICQPYQFIWAGYTAIFEGNRRFLGHRYLVDTEEGRLTIYARRSATGMEILTGVHNWQPVYQPADRVTIDQVIIYYPGSENGPLDGMPGLWDKNY